MDLMAAMMPAQTGVKAMPSQATATGSHGSGWTSGLVRASGAGAWSA
jgi:hypothetical protein